MLYDPLNDYDQVGQTLIKAARHMQEHGMCRAEMTDGKGRVCMLGAICAVTTGSAFDEPYGSHPAYELIQACLGALAAEVIKTPNMHPWKRASHRSTITSFNDCFANQEQVIKMFEQVAEEHKVKV